MKLKDIIELSRNSELSTLAVKDNSAAIVGFVNLGLIELYSMFHLRTEEHVIPLVTGQDIYDVPDDFMHLTGAFEAPSSTSNQNALPLPINEEGNPRSINAVNFSQVQVPLSVTGSYISLIYVVKPPTMTIDDLEEDVPLPVQLVQPLMNFIAYKGHGAVKVDGQGEADIYYMRFKRSCDDVKKLGTGVAPDDLSMSNRLLDRGFV